MNIIRNAENCWQRKELCKALIWNVWSVGGWRTMSWRSVMEGNASSLWQITQDPVGHVESLVHRIPSIPMWYKWHISLCSSWQLTKYFHEYLMSSKIVLSMRKCSKMRNNLLKFTYLKSICRNQDSKPEPFSITSQLIFCLLDYIYCVHLSKVCSGEFRIICPDFMTVQRC